jgi:hypothetical protein
MKYSAVSVVITLALPSLAHQHFIWRPCLDNPGSISIHNNCQFSAYISEAWVGYSSNPSQLSPSNVMSLPLRDNVGSGVDVKIMQDSGPPQDPVELSYDFNPSDTSYNFDLNAVPPSPDFNAFVLVSPDQITPSCQAQSWQPGQPLGAGAQQVCQAGTNLEIYLCGVVPSHKASLSGSILGLY